MTSLVVLFSYQINRISRKEITPQQLYERSYIMILTDLPNAIKKLKEISFHKHYKVESLHVFSSFALRLSFCVIERHLG